MSTAVTFEETLARGRLGERLVVDFLKREGCGVIPSYEYSGPDGDKAPRLMVHGAPGFIVPDIDVCKAGQRFWVEVKTYRGPATNKRRECLVHAIPRRLVEHYRAVQELTGTPVVVLVLEVCSGALLTRRLDHPGTWPCECRPCERGSPWSCYAEIRRGIYWRRDSMALRHSFSDAEMAEIRERWRS
jgi:hypothetical protein